MMQGCQSQAAKVEPGASAVPATPRSAPALSAEDIARLKGLAWIGDANASFMRPFMGRYGQSGYWGDAADNRRSMHTASYALRHGALQGEPGYAVVEETPEGLKLRLYQGLNMAPEELKLELPIKGAIDALSLEAAHDKIALLTWDGARPQLTVYRQADKAQVWSVALDIEPGGATPLVLAWYETGELAVERRGEGTYERVIVSGETGAVLLREQLDPRVVSIIMDPVTFILDAPEVEAVAPSDLAGMSAAQRIVHSSPRSLASICPLGPQEASAVRVLELDNGMLVVAEAAYNDSSDRIPGPPPLSGSACSGVQLMSADPLTVLGRWSTWDSNKPR